ARGQRVEEAVTLVQNALKSDASNVRLIALLANLYWLKNDPRRAEQEYRRALAIDDGFTPARFGLAQLATAGRRELEAIAQLQRVLKDRPNHGPAAAMLAGLY